jgi:putative sigma-54 modulation protein
MKLLIQGNNVAVTEAINDYVQQKLEKSIKHFETLITKVEAHLSVARNPRISNNQKVEVTVYANGSVIRAQESSETLYASVDMVADKIARQLRKYKERQLDHKEKVHLKTGDLVTEQPVSESLVSNLTPTLPAEVVRSKYFAMSAMTIEQALENLQLVDHDFYMFRNQQTDEINVIYKRNHGGYGVIQPRLAQ